MSYEKMKYINLALSVTACCSQIRYVENQLSLRIKKLMPCYSPLQLVKKERRAGLRISLHNILLNDLSQFNCFLIFKILISFCFRNNNCAYFSQLLLIFQSLSFPPVIFICLQTFDGYQLISDTTGSHFLNESDLALLLIKLFGYAF